MPGRLKQGDKNVPLFGTRVFAGPRLTAVSPPSAQNSWCRGLYTPVRGRNPSVVPREMLLFAYGSLLPGEVHEGYLTEATHLEAARTIPGYRLVELAQFPAMIESGTMQVSGELYSVSPDVLRRIDGLKENGRLFERKSVELDDGRSAESYLMSEDKLRGRRRLRIGDWRARFSSGGRSY